jgi:hypothetical protein
MENLQKLIDLVQKTMDRDIEALTAQIRVASKKITDQGKLVEATIAHTDDELESLVSVMETQLDEIRDMAFEIYSRRGTLTILNRLKKPGVIIPSIPPREQ